MTVNIPADKICQGGRRRFWMKAYLKVLAQCISQQQLKSTHFCMGTWPDLKLPESELKSGVCVCVCVCVYVCVWVGAFVWPFCGTMYSNTGKRLSVLLLWGRKFVFLSVLHTWQCWLSLWEQTHASANTARAAEAPGQPWKSTRSPHRYCQRYPNRPLSHSVSAGSNADNMRSTRTRCICICIVQYTQWFSYYSQSYIYIVT